MGFMVNGYRAPQRNDTRNLALGDWINVRVNGRAVLGMQVVCIYPPMSGGRRISAGPRVTAQTSGGYSVTFDNDSTFLEWEEQ